MEGDDPDTILDLIVRERLTQELPKEGRLYVRQRKPRTGLEAAALAEEWFQLREETYSGWTSEQMDQRSSSQPSRDRQQSGDGEIILHGIRGRIPLGEQRKLAKWIPNRRRGPQQRQLKLGRRNTSSPRLVEVLEDEGLSSAPVWPDRTHQT